ncbi:MAG: ABC transporter ATP-binding protein [Gemmatimonadaceae bacterium]
MGHGTLSLRRRAPTPSCADVVSVVLEAIGLRRRFAGRTAVDGVSLSLRAGACLALFGPNGAGKTTLLRLLAGILRPSDGAASIQNITLPGGAAARAMVGLISHHTMLYAPLTALENVEFAARLHGVADPRGAAHRTLSQLGLGDRGATVVRALSRGMQQRVAIARAIVHEPAVVLLDEPYTGLDDSGARALSSALRQLRLNGAAMVLVTHNLTEGLTLATEAAVMVAGRFARHEPRSAIDGAEYAAAYTALVGSAA